MGGLGRLCVLRPAAVVAVGFLVAHWPDLNAGDRFNCAVSICEMEDLTGINFMPLLGANDAMENTPKAELLGLLGRN
jgi:hypothetical protein